MFNCLYSAFPISVNNKRYIVSVNYRYFFRHECVYSTVMIHVSKCLYCFQNYNKNVDI